ncbi:MAG TPA: AAA family ATPase [Bacillota bacterium]|nr:AAA family ATPase [Bacillota bacterium]
MRIKKLNLTGFGRFQNFEQAIDGQFVVIGGKNEAGKSTMANAIAAVLYGTASQRKDFSRRFKPWNDSAVFSVSMLIEDGNGKEYLIGRDFTTGRTEVFRCDGLRLEAMGETFLNELVKKEIGITDPLLFESTLLIREKEMSLLRSNNRWRGSLSQAINGMLAGGGQTVSLNEALQWIEDKLQGLTGDNALEGDRLRAETEELQKQLTKVEEDCWRYLQLRKELQGIEGALAELQEKMGQAQARPKDSPDRNRIKERLAQITEHIGQINQELQTIAAKHEQLKTVMSEEELNRAESLMTRLSAIEIEEKIRVERIREAQARIAAIEKEAAVLREKLQALRDWTDPERQSQIEECLYKVREGQQRLLDQSKQILSQAGVVKRFTLMRNIFLVAALCCGIGAIVSSYFLRIPPVKWLTFLGGEVLMFAGALFAMFQLRLKKNWYAQEEEYYNQLEEEVQEIQRRLRQLMKGKTSEEYQAESQLARFYQNDLWQLEQAIELQMRVQDEEGLTKLREEMAAITQELNELMQPYMIDPAESWLSVLERQRIYVKNNHLVTDEEPPTQRGAEVDDRKKLQAVLAELKAEEASLYDQLRETEADLAELPDKGLLQEEYQRLQLEKTRIVAECEILAQASAGAWELSNRIEEGKHRLAKLAEEERALRITMELLRAAGEAVGGAVPQIQHHFREYLERMTQGRYTNVLVNFANNDLSVQVQTPETGDLISPHLLSTGATDQIYFAFRLALARVIAGVPGYPILLDDPFVHFDRDRLAEAVKLLKELSQNHQIIWWTKNPDLAGELVGINPIYLE